MDPSYPASTSRAPSCFLLPEPHSHMKVFTSNKAKMLWWRLIFLAVGEPHNHKPILAGTLLCLRSSPHGIACITASGTFLCAPPHIKGSECRGWQHKKRKSRTCSIRLLSEHWGLRSQMSCSFVSWGWACCCPRLEHCRLLLCHSFYEKLCVSGGQTACRSYSVCPVISCFGTGRCVRTQHLTVFR